MIAVSNWFTNLPNRKDQLFSYWLTFLTIYFIAAQPISRNDTINAATLLWITGLFLLPKIIKARDVSKPEMAMIVAGFTAFTVAAASWITSDYFSGKFGDLQIEMRFLLFPLAYFAIRQGHFKLEHLSIALLIGSISYLWVSLTTGGRVSGDENAVTFGNGAFLLFATCAALFYVSRSWAIKITTACAAIGFMYAAYASGTRGSFLAIPALAAIFFFTLPGKQKVIMAALVIASIVLLANSNMGQSYKRGINNVQAYFESNHVSSSMGQRLEQWRSAWCMFTEAPLLGKGPHQFKQAIQDSTNQCDIIVTNQKGYYQQAHSYYFNTLATKGILGLIVELGFFLSLIYLGFRKGKETGIVVMAVIGSMLSYGATVDLFFHRYLIDKHLILMAIILGLSIKTKEADSAKN